MSPPSDQDLEDGIRFLHVMGMQTKLDVAESTARLHALIEELVARGVVSLRSLDARSERTRKEEGDRARDQAVVHVGASVDKYTVASPPIDCAALIPLCKGRCCRLQFALSFQDLDEGGIQWEYGRPYMIRHGGDGYCVHSDPATRGCGIYQRRPGVRRTYDCRTDTRIWVDFEKRIPAPDDAIPLVTIRKRTPPAP